MRVLGNEWKFAQYSDYNKKQMGMVQTLQSEIFFALDIHYSQCLQPADIPPGLLWMG